MNDRSSSPFCPQPASGLRMHTAHHCPPLIREFVRRSVFGDRQGGGRTVRAALRTPELLVEVVRPAADSVGRVGCRQRGQRVLCRRQVVSKSALQVAAHLLRIDRLHAESGGAIRQSAVA